MKLYLEQIEKLLESNTGTPQQIVHTNERNDIRYIDYDAQSDSMNMTIIADADIDIHSISWSEEFGIGLNTEEPSSANGEKVHVILWSDNEVSKDERGHYMDSEGALNGVLVINNPDIRITRAAIKEMLDIDLGPQLDDHEISDNQFPLRVYIEKAHMPGNGGFTLPLPSSPEVLRSFLADIEVADWRDIVIMDIESDIAGLGEKLEVFIGQESMSPHWLNELNHLATKIADMHPSEFEVFAAVLEAGKHQGSIAEVINLAGNTGCFYLQPAFSPEEYGEFLLEHDGDNHADVMEVLWKSDDARMVALASYVETLEKYVPRANYGRDAAECEGGVFTQYGYLTESGTAFKTVYRSSEDIPQEHRIFVLPGTEALLIVNNTDLTDLLTKMHALGGDFMSDAQHNVCTLEARRSEEYLLMMTERGVYLTEASSAYRRDSDAFREVTNDCEKANNRAFALHITDVHGEHVVGDLAEINAGGLQRDIEKMCVDFTHVEAVSKTGEELSFTPEIWDAMSDIQRDDLQGGWVRKFDPDDLKIVRLHLGKMRIAHEFDVGKAVEPEAFLADLNKAYMVQAENPQPDMLRVTLPAAKDILTRGDAVVYRLMPEGPKEMSTLDALPTRGGLWYSHYREFAVKDVNALDKWAERTARKLTAPPNLDEREKPRSRGPEL